MAASPHMANGAPKVQLREEQELQDKLLQLRDAVLAGDHPRLKLPESAIKELKSSLEKPDGPREASNEQAHANGVNTAAYTANVSTQPAFPTSQYRTGSLPGLKTSTTSLPNGAASTRGVLGAGLDPIFLEKSDSLVRAEGQLKRQRIERDLQTQVEKRKHIPRDRDNGTDGPLIIDVEAVLLQAFERVKPVSGSSLAGHAGSQPSSVFDENDYYSSLVESDWSTDPSSSKGPEKTADAFKADFERVDDAPNTSAPRGKQYSVGLKPGHGADILRAALRDDSLRYGERDHTFLDHADEDDEYAPPDAAAFDSSRGDATALDKQQGFASDEDSEYEPGEITLENYAPASNAGPSGPVIRNNHLTHIAAPQPNHVSPLATAKGPALELELVNGCPQVVPKPQKRRARNQIRLSSASPSGNGASGASKKKRMKKRKRDTEPAGRGKRRREKHAAAQSPTSPREREPYIKDEPLSPPSLAGVPQAPLYEQPRQYHRPTEIDLRSPAHVTPLQYRVAEPDYLQSNTGPAPSYQYQPPKSALRYEYVQPTSQRASSGSSMASPSYRPAQRDTQDLRRVATLQHAQRPLSPARQEMYPADARRIVSSQAPLARGDYEPNHYHTQAPEPTQYIRTERSRSPPKQQEYRSAYAARPASPPTMAPPNPPRQHYVVDQYGRYYLAEPEPVHAALPRASVAPFARAPPTQPEYERVASRAETRMSVAHPPPAPEPPHYDPADARMGPPPIPPHRQQHPQQRFEYDELNGYRVREYSTRPVESSAYSEAATSPGYREAPEYVVQMPPPPATNYAPRSYSVRPEEPQYAPTTYARQPSMAPPPPPERSVSVVHGNDYVALQPQGYQQYQDRPPRAYSQVPQQSIRYVDQFGNEVFPQEIRQVNEFRY